METASLYSEARNEYLKQMATWIVPPLVEFFRTQYNTLYEKEGKKVMGAFQTYCSEVPRWNQDVIDANINIILDNCRCDYMEELMTAVFIAYTKMLTAIRINSKQKKLQITLPKLDHFLHRVFIECARSFWKAPYLFAHELAPIEKQKNILQAEQMCTDALSGAVRSLLPVKSILRDYLDDGEDADMVADVEKELDDDADKDDAEPVETVDPAPLPQVKDVKIQTVPESPTKGGDAVAAVSATPAVAVATVAAPVAPAVAVPAVAVATVAAPVAPVAPAAPVAPVAPAAPAAPVSEAPVLIVEPAVAPTPEPALVVEPTVTPVPDTKSAPVVIEKLSTSPVPPTITPSAHHVSNVAVPPPVATVSKSDYENVMIDTEPAVHFSAYDTVFDETTSDISHIRHSPRDSSIPPRLSFGQVSEALDSLEIDDLEPAAAVRAPTPVDDIDAPLGSTDDFEVLA
jgi:Family of unknown function (DUF5764)